MIKLKLKIPKVKLSTLLLGLLVIVVLIEAFILYKAFFYKTPARDLGDGAEAPLVIDAAALKKLQSWLLQKGQSLPPRNLGNPFAEYK